MKHMLIALLVVCTIASAHGEDQIFSGPQVGERLVPFEATGVLGKMAGEKVEVVARSKQSPLLLIFVHRITRPSIGLLRTITTFANAKEQKGIKTELVFLADDRTAMEATIRRAQHALPKGVDPLISTDGAEGPGSYGLNRKMTLTILVSQKDKVTANFPLIQPSLQVDAPKIGHAIVKAVGGKKQPTLKDMGFDREKMMARRPRPGKTPNIDAIYRPMMAPLIRKDASKEDVDKAAKAIEELAAKNKAFRDKVGTASGLITNSGRLASYGTKHAQTYLKKWAKEYASKKETRKKRSPEGKAKQDKQDVTEKKKTEKQSTSTKDESTT